MNRTATCACGQLSVVVSGDPAMQGICNCLSCQRQTGSVFYHHGYWPKSAVREIKGQTTAWRRNSEAGRWAETHFCTVCGSTVYYYSELFPDAIGISIGSLADPAFPAPQYSVWQRHKHAWVQVPESCAAMDTQP